MDNKMDNFGVKKIRQKNNYVEKDQMKRVNKTKKNTFSDDKKKWITHDFETIKSIYGCYYCTSCDFSTKNLKDYKRHLNTKKHKKKTPKKTPTFKTINQERYVCICGKDYKYRSGLSKHKIKCKKIKKFGAPDLKTTQSGISGHKNLSETENFEPFCKNFETTKKRVVKVLCTNQQNENVIIYGEEKPNNDKAEISEFVKQSLNQTETINKLLEQNNILIEKLSKVPASSTNNIIYQNCGNKKMTINLFLNEQCKDAMNLSDFVNNLNISLEDILYTKEHGYMKGISNIFVKRLQDLEPSERPIHCSDTKRLQFYVRDENKWQKDRKNKKIDKSINDLTVKQIKQLREWEQKNPNYLQDEKLLNQWQELVHKIMGPATDSEREKEKEQILKEIGSTTEIKDNLVLDDLEEEAALSSSVLENKKID